MYYQSIANIVLFADSFFKDNSSMSVIETGFHISHFIGDPLSGIAEGENDFRNTKDFIHR